MSLQELPPVLAHRRWPLPNKEASVATVRGSQVRCGSLSPAPWSHSIGDHAHAHIAGARETVAKVVEVDFGTDVPMLEGHVASSRPIWLRRSGIARYPVFVLALCCPIRKYAA